MEFTFANGTPAQQQGWREVADLLLNLPDEALPLSVNVSFADPNELHDHGHTDLAFTTWAYGSPSSTTQVRNDAPGFGEQEASLKALAASLGIEWNSPRFYTETAGHELGHSAFAALPAAYRQQVAELFGARSDSTAELQPAGTSWQDQIIEGIAETFKEAFIPRSRRVFPNRTRRKIPYWQYSEFRRLFREGLENIEVSEPEVDVPIFEQGGWTSGAWFDSRGGLYSGIDPSGAVKFQSNSSWAPFSVVGGYDFAFSWALPAAIFNIAGTAQTQLRIKFRAAKGHSSGLEVWSRWMLIIVYTPETDTYSISIEENGGSIVNPPEIPGGSFVNKESGGIHWIEVEGVRPPLTLKCAFESTWAAEELQAMEVTAEVDFFAFSAEEIASEAFLSEFAVPFRLTIPNFRYTLGGASVRGVPIVIPASEFKGGGQTSGRRVKPPTIVGRRR